MDRRAVLLSACTLIVLLGAPTAAPAQGPFPFPFPLPLGERGLPPGTRGEIDTPPNRRQIERRESEYGRRQSDYRRRQIERERLLELQYEQQRRRQAEKRRNTPPVGGKAAKDVVTPGRAVTAPSSPAIVNKPAQTPSDAPMIVSKPSVSPAPDKDGSAPGGPVVGTQPTQTPSAAPVIVTKPAPTVSEKEVATTAPTAPTTTPQNSIVTTPGPEKAVTAPAITEPAVVTQPSQTASAPTTSPSTAPSPTAPAPTRDIDFSDVDTSVTPALSSDDTRRVQVALKGRGFDPGPIDGVLNPQTQAALRTFQTTYGINARGVVDSQTLLALGEAELASRPAK